jgi:pantoate--beta-alanine ligase
MGNEHGAQKLRPEDFVSGEGLAGSGASMEVFETIAEFKRWRNFPGKIQNKIGLVPTMGALHEGHLSLMRRASKDCSTVVVSIFVNPAQFGPDEDLNRYPRTREHDLELLRGESVTAVFIPEPAEMYPPGFRTYVTVEELGGKLCGLTRPTHFRGVATVVLKLLNVVEPHMVFFGQKDAQQLILIRRMARDLNLGIDIVGCPIVREADGLAMSSRNRYLSPPERKAALVLSQSLEWALHQVKAGEKSGPRILQGVKNMISREHSARLDYAEIVETTGLEPIMELDGRETLLALAAYVGGTRLIDNLIISKEDGIPSGKSLIPVI